MMTTFYFRTALTALTCFLVTIFAATCLSGESFRFSSKEVEAIYKSITGRNDSEGTAYGEQLYAFPADEERLDLIFDGWHFVENGTL